MTAAFFTSLETVLGDWHQQTEKYWNTWKTGNWSSINGKLQWRQWTYYYHFLILFNSCRQLFFGKYATVRSEALPISMHHVVNFTSMQYVLILIDIVTEGKLSTVASSLGINFSRRQCQKS